jgi:hypothetical protein
LPLPGCPLVLLPEDSWNTHPKKQERAESTKEKTRIDLTFLLSSVSPPGLMSVFPYEAKLLDLEKYDPW